MHGSTPQVFVEIQLPSLFLSHSLLLSTEIKDSNQLQASDASYIYVFYQPACFNQQTFSEATNFLYKDRQGCS